MDFVSLCLKINCLAYFADRSEDGQQFEATFAAPVHGGIEGEHRPSAVERSDDIRYCQEKWWRKFHFIQHPVVLCGADKQIP